MLKAISRLFEKKSHSKTLINESWNKHIQPILDSWQHWDNYSWVWDPFEEAYPKFSAEQKAQIDNALAICAFDTMYEVSAMKAFAIAGFLQTNHLASLRLTELMRNGLRERLSSLDPDSALTFDYVVAFDFFRVKEAIPYLKELVICDLSDIYTSLPPKYKTFDGAFIPVPGTALYSWVTPGGK